MNIGKTLRLHSDWLSGVPGGERAAQALGEGSAE